MYPPALRNGWHPANPPPPPTRIWAHIRGCYWSAKIDDISLWPPAFCTWEGVQGGFAPLSTLSVTYTRTCKQGRPYVCPLCLEYLPLTISGRFLSPTGFAAVLRQSTPVPPPSIPPSSLPPPPCMRAKYVAWHLSPASLPYRAQASKALEAVRNNKTS